MPSWDTEAKLVWPSAAVYWYHVLSLCYMKYRALFGRISGPITRWVHFLFRWKEKLWRDSVSELKTCSFLFHIDPQQVNGSHLVQWQDKSRWMALDGSLCKCDRIQLVSEKNYSNFHKTTGFCRDMHRHSSVKTCTPSSAVMCRDMFRGKEGRSCPVFHHFPASSSND